MISGRADIAQDFVVEPLQRNSSSEVGDHGEIQSYTHVGGAGEVYGSCQWILVCVTLLFICSLFIAEPQKWHLQSDTDIDIEVRSAKYASIYRLSLYAVPQQ